MFPVTIFMSRRRHVVGESGYDRCTCTRVVKTLESGLAVQIFARSRFVRVRCRYGSRLLVYFGPKYKGPPEGGPILKLVILHYLVTSV